MNGFKYAVIIFMGFFLIGCDQRPGPSNSYLVNFLLDPFAKLVISNPSGQTKSRANVSPAIQKPILPAKTASVCRCGAITLAMGLYNKNQGNISDGNKLINYALAWSKTAFAVGAQEGVSSDAVKAENQKLSDSISKNFGAFLEGAPQDMSNCSSLLKSDSALLSIFQKNLASQ